MTIIEKDGSRSWIDRAMYSCNLQTSRGWGRKIQIFMVLHCRNLQLPLVPSARRLGEAKNSHDSNQALDVVTVRVFSLLRLTTSAYTRCLLV